MLREELKMLSGVFTDDINYIGYLLLKDGAFFTKNDEEEVQELGSNSQVEDLNAWFENI